jgi:hypothetical protein
MTSYIATFFMYLYFYILCILLSENFSKKIINCSLESTVYIEQRNDVLSLNTTLLILVGTILVSLGHYLGLVTDIHILKSFLHYYLLATDELLAEFVLCCTFEEFDLFIE